MFRRMSGGLAFGVFLATQAMVGCVAPDSSEVDDDVEVDDELADEEYLTSTVVEIGEDGEARVVAVEHLTKAEMKAEIEARVALMERAATDAIDGLGSSQAALTRDTVCGSHSLWLYDKAFDASWNNTGNRLCIKGPSNGGDAGGVYSNVCRVRMPSVGGGTGPCLKWWGGAVRAYWSGDDHGYFSSHAACASVYGVEAFDWYQRSNAGSCAQTANELYFATFLP